MMLKKWWVWVAAVGLSTACDSEPTVVDTGTVDVTVTTTGALIDGDGYTLVVDDLDEGTINTDGTTTLELSDGDHTVQLTDMIDPCVVDGDNPASVSVVVGESAALVFNVEC